MPADNAFAGEIIAADDDRTPRPPKFKRRAMPLEVTPHRFFWYGEHVRRTRPEIEDQEILR